MLSCKNKSIFELMAKANLLIFALVFNPMNAKAATFNHRWDLSATAQGRQINQEGFSEINETLDGFFLLGLDQNVKSSKWFFEIRPELRLLKSITLTTLPEDISRVQLTDENRFMILHKKLYPETEDSNANEAAVFDIEKLNIRYQGEVIEFILGRNPFNPSIMRLAPIWNKFSRDIFFTGYPNFVFNPDILSFKYQKEKFWLQNVSVNRDAYLLFAGLNFEKLENQILAGKMFGESVIGLNANFSTEESLLKMELLYVLGDSEQMNQHLQSAVGYETSWNESLSTVTEIIYSDLALNYQNPTDISLGTSKFSRLRSELYLVNQFDYLFSDIWIGSFTPAFNLMDSSCFTITSLKGNLTDNLEITFNVKYAIGSEGSEFSNKSILYDNGFYIGNTNTVYAMIKYFFN